MWLVSSPHFTVVHILALVSLPPWLVWWPSFIATHFLGFGGQQLRSSKLINQVCLCQFLPVGLQVEVGYSIALRSWERWEMPADWGKGQWKHLPATTSCSPCAVSLNQLEEAFWGFPRAFPILPHSYLFFTLVPEGVFKYSILFLINNSNKTLSDFALANWSRSF